MMTIAASVQNYLSREGVQYEMITPASGSGVWHRNDPR